MVQERTEVNDVEHLRAPVLCDTGEELTVRARGGRDYGREVRPVHLHELNALFLLLPQLDNAVDRRRHEELRPARAMRLSRRMRGEADAERTWS